MTEGSTLGALANGVVDAVGRATGTEALLYALAALDPARVGSFLRQPESMGLPRPQLTRVLASLADAVAINPELAPPDELVEIVARHGQLLPPDGAMAIVAAIRASEHDSQLGEALRVALERAESHPGLLRAAAELAMTMGDAPRAHDLLSRLGRVEQRLATLQYIRAARSRLGRSGLPPVRVALLSSFTIDSVVPFLDLECRSLELEPNIYIAPFNSWEREMIGENSGLREFEPELAFLSVAADDLISCLGTGSAADVEATGATAVERLVAAAARFVSWSAATLVVHGLYTVFADPSGPAAGRVGRSRTEVLNGLNARLAAGLRELPRTYLLDLPDVLLRRSEGALDNPKMRHLAGMRLGEQVLGEVARAYAQFVAPVKGRTRKCVVLDLDNTLWGGIVGEDGLHGIRLGNTSPGSEYREFQQYLLALSQRGILLAVNSKNNPADALEVIRSHEAMVLREEAFSAMRINWEHKPNNMLALAEELGLGLDSLVFVDDSEKERALMRQALPQVLTPELPRDPARYRAALESLPQLQVLTITEEDRTRTRQYAERRQREQLRISTQTVDQYLRSLEIVAVMAPATERTLNRVHQLFQRTNQFNLTGRRYELGTLAERAADATWRIYTARVSDRFGDHGLVASALVQVTPEEWLVENFVMSCRVIGYGVEDALLAHLAADARSARGQWLVGEFKATPKNAPAKDFYQRNAFQRDLNPGETERWRWDLTEGSPRPPAWIAVKVADGA